MNKEIPQPTLMESVSPAPRFVENDGDLSHGLSKKNKRLIGTAGITAGAVLASSIGVAAAEEQPSPSPELPTPIVSFMEVADTDNSGYLDLGEVIIGIPNYAEAVAQRANEIAEEYQPEQEPEPRNLKKLFNKKAKLPKGNLEEIRTELFEYLAENPEVDEKVSAINPGFDPDEFFEFCISGKSDMKLTGCANILIFMMQVHKISNSEKVYDMTAGLMGATKYDMGSAFNSIYDLEMKNQKKHPELYE